MNVIWLRIAAEHLEEIYEFLLKNNARAAADLYNDILDETEKLSGFPQIASLEQYLAEEPEMFRSLVIRRQYKVVYFIEDEVIKIADVWDCRQNPAKMRRGLLKKKSRK